MIAQDTARAVPVAHGLPPRLSTAVPADIELEQLVRECEQRLGLVPTGDRWNG